MLHEKPSGVMHDAIRRAVEELRTNNNPYGTITLVTSALANSDIIPLPSGRDYVNAGRASPADLILPYSGPSVPGGDNSDAVYASMHSSVPNTVFSAGETASPAAGSGRLRVPLPPQQPQQQQQQSLTSSLVHGFVVGGSVSPEALTTPTRGGAVGGASRGRTAVDPGDDSTNSVDPAGRVHFNFNPTQIQRLLLIRAEAYSITKQHEYALQDAQCAVEISQGKSPEAYFTVGREQRKLLRINESVSAFDTSEALLLSLKQCLPTSAPGDFRQETESDDQFWEQRGLQTADAKALGISRREMEMEEIAISASAGARGGNGGGSVLVRAVSPSSMPSPSASMANLCHISDSAAASYAAVTSGCGPAAPAVNDQEMEEMLYARCGLSSAEVAMWRRLATESRALAAMKVSHTVPTSVLSVTMTLLDTRISSVRGGIAISVENGTNRPMTLLGCTAPDAAYHGAFCFPSTIPKGYCGLALLQPRSWGGFSGYVCYALHEQLSCFLYFDCPLLGGVKYGVRFTDIRATDLHRALVNAGSAGVNGIQGAPGSSTVAPVLPPVQGAPPNGIASGRVVIIGNTATTPRPQQRTRELEAAAAVRMPNVSVWSNHHRMASPRNNAVRVSSHMIGNRAICYAAAELMTVRLRGVELIPVLEYCGPVTLKKVSAASRRLRQLVNNLPPPLFYGAGRRAYPDYTLPSDRHNSPWVVHNKEAVTWRLTFDSRTLIREEYLVTSENESKAFHQYPTLCISTEVQSKLASNVYYGDKRCALALIKESWIPFSSTVYFTTPLGRTYATCSSPSPGVFTLAVGGTGTNKPEDVLYTARKRVAPGDGRVLSGNVMDGSSESDQLFQGSVSSGGGGGGIKTGTLSPAGPGTNGAGGGVISATRLSGFTSATNLGGPAAVAAGGTGAAPGGSTFVSATASTNLFSRRMEYYTIWRSQSVSGGALLNSAAPHTNEGMEIIAEVRVSMIASHPHIKGFNMAEMRLLPGADALLVSLMSFCITKW